MNQQLVTLLPTFYNRAHLIYQGQEIGMTNYPFESIESFNDVAVKTEYQIVKKKVEMSINY